MAYIVVTAAALIVAALTLFSGFGLGTLLMPVFALFFPLEVAIATTAVVHLANNLFKIALVGAWANLRVLLKFAVPAALAAVLGARVLDVAQEVEPLYRYTLGSRHCEVTAIKLVIASLIAAFTLLELLPRFKQLTFSERYVPLGGVLSGFFGGLSGHQGALRAAFLIRAGLEKKEFLGTVVLSAVVVDVARLTVYGLTYFETSFSVLASEGRVALVVVAVLAAFAGSALGRLLVKKVSLSAVNRIVAILLILLALALGSGVV